MTTTPKHTSWIEIKSCALKNNLEIFRNIIGKNTSLGVVLKSNAYGHGLVDVLSILHDKVDLIHVISPEDALFIRGYEKKNNLSPKRILVLGSIDKNHLYDMMENNIELVLYGSEFLSLFENINTKQKFQIHLHIDTGLGREGLKVSQIDNEMICLEKIFDKVEIKGIMSHFANTEDVTDQTYAKEQLGVFNETVIKLQKKYPGLANIEKHFAASAATMLLPESRFDSVRIGISLYGLWASSETKVSYNVLSKELPDLQPVMSWKTKSQTVKKLEPGSFIGYGRSYKCECPTRIAVLPVGYFDGYPRILGNKAHVLVEGQRCPVIGRIMMNHIVIDITNVTNDNRQITATLLGEDHGEKITAEMIAEWSSTINYEVVTRIGAHLPRILRTD